MKNEKIPLQPVTEFYTLSPKLDKKIEVIVELQPNEFIDDQGLLDIETKESFFTAKTT